QVFFYRPANSLYLVNDAGTGPLAPLPVGGGGNVQNTQCLLDGTGSSVSGAGNNLTVTLLITFKPAFFRGKECVHERGRRGRPKQRLAGPRRLGGTVTGNLPFCGADASVCATKVT